MESEVRQRWISVDVKRAKVLVVSRYPECCVAGSGKMMIDTSSSLDCFRSAEFVIHRTTDNP